ncbi:Tetratricopeptide repeat-domain-containing protein [Flagelloscypha sp. PMI_526]|nr:Tetratricopeptide repeat-domain-containing protein [Flagelloscypha sp. PMI_526]
MANLPSTYSNLGQYSDARNFQVLVLALWTRFWERSTHGHSQAWTVLPSPTLILSLGEKHPDTLKTVNNLAVIYSDLGKPRDSVKLLEQALRLRTEILGERHPQTLTSMGSMAIAYLELGQHSEALKLGKQALELRTQTLGEKHLVALSSMDN